MPDLKLENLSVAHLHPVSMIIHAGEIVCVSGESGSGKSLLLRAIADLIPHEGEAYSGEEPANAMSAPDWRKKVSLLPAESQWWNEKIGQHFKNIDKSDLATLGLSEAALDWDVARCSTGEKQRLALLRVLALQPDCLLLDEPTGSLDSQNTQRVEGLITTICQQRNIPVIWVSHSEEQIKRIASRHFVMQQGQLKEQVTGR